MIHFRTSQPSLWLTDRSRLPDFDHSPHRFVLLVIESTQRAMKFSVWSRREVVGPALAQAESVSWHANLGLHQVFYSLPASPDFEPLNDHILSVRITSRTFRF